jgi:hypothetical protein
MNIRKGVYLPSMWIPPSTYTKRNRKESERKEGRNK